MTITHDHAKGGQHYKTQTQYRDHTLTRIIGAKINTIHMKHKTAIEDLERLSKLDDEEFSMMAELQQSRA